MVSLGFLLAILIVYFETKRKGLDPNFALDLGLTAMIAGILGGKLLFVIRNWNYYSEYPINILFDFGQGFISYGGLILGAIAVILVGHFKKISIGSVADICAPAVPLGYAIGRIGCLLRGCCFGKVCNYPWAIYLEGALRHPTQIYHSLHNFLIFVFLWFIRKKIKVEGNLLLIYLILYSTGRFITEFFRENPIFAFGLTGSQVFSILLFFGSSIFLIYRYAIYKRI
jgi:prolipoprotein diacylglyceryl transferase